MLLSLPLSSLSSRSTLRHEWEARLYRAHATGDGALCKIFSEQSASAVISSREQHEGKCLNLWEHFTAFALLRLTYSTYTIRNTEAKQHHDNITSSGYLWVIWRWEWLTFYRAYWNALSPCSEGSVDYSHVPPGNNGQRRLTRKDNQMCDI